MIAKRGDDDDVESAANLRAAYAVAKLLTPGGNALSATNRATCFVLPGRYDFGTGNGTNHGLVLDTQFVDLVGLSSNPSDTVLASQISTPSRGTLEQTADNVKIANLTLEISATGDPGTYAVAPAAYWPTTNLPNAECRNVVFRSTNESAGYGMRAVIIYSGKYTDCIAGIFGFGANGLVARTASGTAASRTVTGTTNRISVTNGDGVSGNPTLTVPDAAQLNIDDITGTGEVTVNEAGANLDFRVESDNSANMLVVDASADAIGIGTNAPSNKALMEFSSTTRGLLFPRLTTTERDAISSPPAGLFLYNSTTNKLNFYSGSAWEAVTSA